jgi:hypothetical protein
MSFRTWELLTNRYPKSSHKNDLYIPFVLYIRSVRSSYVFIRFYIYKGDEFISRRKLIQQCSPSIVDLHVAVNNTNLFIVATEM